MNEELNIDIKYPRIALLIVLSSTCVSFLWGNNFYEYLESVFLSDIDNSLIEIAIKMGLFFFYLIPLAIGALLFRSKKSFIQILSMFFIGLGLGIVLKITLFFVRAINPYSF